MSATHLRPWGGSSGDYTICTGGKVTTQAHSGTQAGQAPPARVSTPLTCGLCVLGTLAQASRPSRTPSSDAIQTAHGREIRTTSVKGSVKGVYVQSE